MEYEMSDTQVKGNLDQPTVDHAALRVNQAFIIFLLVLAFIIDSWLLVALVALVMLVGSAVPRAALFKLIYSRLLQPAGLVKPDVIADNPEPHRFAQGFGGVVLALALIALLLGPTGLGWSLVWLVIALAALNLFLGFCAGCFLYYQLNRLNVPGFDRRPVTGSDRGAGQ
jgi:hypothetical protein